MTVKPIEPRTLMDLGIGQCSRIAKIRADLVAERRKDVDALDLEGRLLEMGFVEGEEVELLHVGPVGRDPLAVRVGRMVVALRRHEARAVVLSGEPEQGS